MVFEAQTAFFSDSDSCSMLAGIWGRDEVGENHAVAGKEEKSTSISMVVNYVGLCAKRQINEGDLVTPLTGEVVTHGQHHEDPIIVNRVAHH